MLRQAGPEQAWSETDGKGTMEVPQPEAEPWGSRAEGRLTWERGPWAGAGGRAGATERGGQQLRAEDGVAEMEPGRPEEPGQEVQVQARQTETDRGKQRDRQGETERDRQM